MSDGCKCGRPFTDHLEAIVKRVGAFRSLPTAVYLCPDSQYRPQREARAKHGTNDLLTEKDGLKK